MNERNNKLFIKTTDFINIIESNCIIKKRQFCTESDNHGKSSFVFFVKCEDEEYVFKFPRTVFQSDLLNYEYEVLLRLNNKFDFLVSNYRVFNDNLDRPYVAYNKIKGVNMADFQFSDLELERLSFVLAKEIYKIHCLSSNDLKGLEIHTKRNLLDNFCKDFNYTPDYSLISDLLDEDTFIHGDFHRHNILLNNNKEFVAILDFATFSKGSIYFDLGHMILSVKSPLFREKFIENYEKISRKKINIDKLERVMKFIYTLINENYLLYINNKE